MFIVRSNRAAVPCYTGCRLFTFKTKKKKLKLALEKLHCNGSMIFYDGGEHMRGHNLYGGGSLIIREWYVLNLWLTGEEDSRGQSAFSCSQSPCTFWHSKSLLMSSKRKTLPQTFRGVSTTKGPRGSPCKHRTELGFEPWHAHVAGGIAGPSVRPL